MLLTCSALCWYCTLARHAPPPDGPACVESSLRGDLFCPHWMRQMMMASWPTSGPTESPLERGRLGLTDRKSTPQTYKMKKSTVKKDTTSFFSLNFHCPLTCVCLLGWRGRGEGHQWHGRLSLGSRHLVTTRVDGSAVRRPHRGHDGYIWLGYKHQAGWVDHTHPTYANKKHIWCLTTKQNAKMTKEWVIKT